MASLQSRCIVTLVCIAFGVFSACAPALANPALWVVKSRTATVYLFGTVHALPKSLRWRYPALDDALAASDELYLEEDDGSPARLDALVHRYGLLPVHPGSVALDFSYDSPFEPDLYPIPSDSLYALLDGGDRSRLNSITRDRDIPDTPAVLERMRPWLAALTIAFAPIRKAGYSPRFGVDRQLEHEFTAEGKPVGAFETSAQQVRLFADMPRPLQLRLLHKVLVNYGGAPGRTQELVHDWQAGDVAGIADVANATMRQDYPALYGRLMVDRNGAWAGQIARLLQRPGTVFVAVGAGHLAGPDSVQAQLAKLGIKTERVH